MPLNKTYDEYSFRIALVIDGSSLVGQRMMSGLCRRATAYPNLLVRRYFVDTLTAEGIDPLAEWKPDATIVYCGDTSLLKKIRTVLPKAPMVAMSAEPPDLVDLVITGNAHEVAALSLDHFADNGLTHFAMFYTGEEEPAHRYADLCRQHLGERPATFSHFNKNIDIKELQRTPSGKALEEIEAWLKRLPKPVGIFSPSDHAAGYLIRVCNHVGLTIPKHVQLIGCDELDESLECFPHLTSIHLPAERIGGVALKTALNLLRGEKPESEITLVDGASLLPQGSTGIIPKMLSDIPAAIAYIESHATQGVTVDDVAQATQHVSRMTFYRDFKKEVGDSPAHYIRRIRLEAACRLLSTTQVEITHVAELSGFSGSNYFAQVFRREIGMTPNQYRKANSEKQ